MKKILLVSITFSILVLTIFYIYTIVNQKQIKTDSYFTSNNINEFDPILIQQANKVDHKPFKNDLLKISKIAKINENIYVIIYDQNNSFSVFEKILPANEYEEGYYNFRFNSESFNCLQTNKLNIPNNFIEKISNIKCTEFKYNNTFSLINKNPKYGDKLIKILQDSEVVQNSPGNCLDLSQGIGCDYVKLLINYPPIINYFVIFSNSNSNYFNKYSPHFNDLIFDGIEEYKKFIYYDNKYKPAAVNFCNNKGYCIGFEASSNDVYFDNEMGLEEFLFIKQNQTMLWSSDVSIFYLMGTGTDTNLMREFLNKHINVPLPLVSESTFYIGKQNSITCDEHRQMYPESKDTPDNELKFRCNYTSYVFAVPKYYMSYEQVVDKFTNGVEGFTLHGGAGDQYGTRFGSLSYSKLKKSLGMDDYYLSIENSNPYYVIYKVSYDSK